MSNKKTLVKVVATMMAATSLFSFASCGGLSGDDHSEQTVILVKNFGGGVGRLWLDNAIERFNTFIGDRSYEEGKTGVYFKITSSTGVKSEGMRSDGTHMYFLQEKYSNCYALLEDDAMLDITDIVREQTLEEYGESGTIEDKINPAYRFAMQGSNGRYYMLPHYETQAGASYDVDLFTDRGFYLAKEGEGDPFNSVILGETYYFTGEPDEKTVGNDGKMGTDDDGMPTTLNELVVMCEYIKDANIPVFSVPGSHLDYTNALIEGLWTALAGYEQRAAVAQLSGEVDYVTGISNEELWEGTGIMKPITEKAQVTEETGYKAINQAGRYYAIAFIELAYQQSWFYGEYTNKDYLHNLAHRAFILNGLSGYDVIASHVEGSYWYNEAKEDGQFDKYKQYSEDGSAVKNIGHWHMPTSYGDDVVTGEENKREETVINAMTATAMINGNIDDRPGNEGKIQACKDFLKFLYTEQELKNFTALTGVSKALCDYAIDDSVLSQLDPYQQEIMRLRANNPVVHQYGNNDMYRNYSHLLMYSAASDGYKPTVEPTDYSTVLELFTKDATRKTWWAFEHLGQNADSWAALMEKIR